MYLWLQWSCSVVCPSSGIPVYWQNLVWKSLGQVTSQLATPYIYTIDMVRVVWANLISFDLRPQMNKNHNGAHIQDMHRVMLKYPRCTLAQRKGMRKYVMSHVIPMNLSLAMVGIPRGRAYKRISTADRRAGISNYASYSIWDKLSH